MQFKRLSTLVFQATSLCNFNCHYCYLSSEERAKSNIIDFQIIEKTFINLCKERLLEDRLIVAWHAGEPLTLPVNFYEHAFLLIKHVLKKYGMGHIKLTHSFQTNASLINREWCEFFVTHPEVWVGVSIDGPEAFQNHKRLLKNNEGSFKQTLRGINYLKHYDIPFSVISVITDYSINYPDELFQFYKTISPVQVSFNPEEVEAHNNQSSLDYTINHIILNNYEIFLKRMLFLTQTQAPSFLIKNFENKLGFIAAPEYFNRCTALYPFEQICVDYKGNFTFLTLEHLTATHHEWDDFLFGNVQETGFKTSLNNPKFQAIHQSILIGADFCKNTCEYFDYCESSFYGNKYFETGSYEVTETIACKLKLKTVYDVLMDAISDELQFVN